MCLVQHVKSTWERFETWRVLITCQEVVKMRPVAKNWVVIQNPHTDIWKNTHSHLQSTNANTKNEHLQVHKDTHTHTKKPVTARKEMHV